MKLHVPLNYSWCTCRLHQFSVGDELHYEFLQWRLATWCSPTFDVGLPFTLALMISWTIYKVLGQPECDISITLNLFNNFPIHLTGIVSLLLVTFICYLSVWVQPSCLHKRIISRCSSDIKDKIWQCPKIKVDIARLLGQL